MGMARLKIQHGMTRTGEIWDNFKNHILMTIYEALTTCLLLFQALRVFPPTRWGWYFRTGGAGVGTPVCCCQSRST